ncbi:MAG: sarcosine/dimethylglycine N-methyltransferase [Saprospiraceae bacterium]|jgi:sarcosine/dimethylglycine N-methyltransferase|tara:strand:+ start:348 stop:1133 length:786 start_codon:yes stop_codon:yes gene_type:complete
MYNKKEVEVIKIEIPFNIGEWKTFHTGIYKGDDEDIDTALQHTIERMVRLMPNIKKSSKILVLGGANSYPAVFLATRYGSKTDCIAQSDEAAKTIEKYAKSHGKDDTITVHVQPFSKTMFSDGNFDIIWSMDGVHTTENKRTMIREAARLLVPEGRFIFCDYMKKGSGDSEDTDEYVTSKGYLKLADKADLERVYLREMAGDASRHHEILLEQIEKNKAKLAKKVGAKELDTITAEIAERKSKLDNGELDWGFLQFQKRNV